MLVPLEVGSINRCALGTRRLGDYAPRGLTPPF
jgi:hypothetical protein